jgi:7-carboxy-7-deazaguanine synthase
MRVAELFQSIQGESTAAGRRCAFVRLAGCNLRCRWCDTAWAQSDDGAEELSIDDIVERLAAFDCPLVEVTGGEPLLQGDTPLLIERLIGAGHEVLVESNGSIDIGALPEGCRCILDMKPPSSGMTDRMDMGNLDRLRDGDEVKIVIADDADFRWAADLVSRYDLAARHTVIVQPVHGAMSLRELAGRIVKQKLNLRLGVQLHKLIWPDRDRGV